MNAVTGEVESTARIPRQLSAIATNRELGAPETSPPILRSSFLDVRFLCRQAAGSRTCNTFHQQYGDITLVEFRVH